MDALWIIQGLLAVFFLFTGLTKLTESRAELVSRGMNYLEELTDRQAKCIGGLEVVAAIGLTLPAALDLVPVLTAVAGSGVVFLMLATMRVQLRRSEMPELKMSLVVACIALFVAVARF